MSCLKEQGVPFIAQKVEESPGDIQASSAESMVNFIEDMGSLKAAAAP